VLAAGALLLSLFVANEARAPQPIMPLRLFASRERAGAYAARILYLGAMMGFWFFITQFLQGVIGMRPFQAGIAFLPLMLSNFAVAMTVPKLTRLIGNARLLACGIAITLIGMASLTLVSAGTSYLAGMVLPMILLGIGQGGTLSPLTVASLVDVAREDAGAASGLVNAAHQLGGSLGIGILVTVFATASSHTFGDRDLLAQGIAAALTASTIMLALCLMLVLMLIVRPRKTAGAVRAVAEAET